MYSVPLVTKSVEDLDKLFDAGLVVETGTRFIVARNHHNRYNDSQITHRINLYSRLLVADNTTVDECVTVDEFLSGLDDLGTLGGS